MPIVCATTGSVPQVRTLLQHAPKLSPDRTFASKHSLELDSNSVRRQYSTLRGSSVERKLNCGEVQRWWRAVGVCVCVAALRHRSHNQRCLPVVMQGRRGGAEWPLYSHRPHHFFFLFFFFVLGFAVSSLTRCFSASTRSSIAAASAFLTLSACECPSTSGDQLRDGCHCTATTDGSRKG